MNTISFYREILRNISAGKYRTPAEMDALRRSLSPLRSGGEIDLNSPAFVARANEDNPDGFEDQDLAFIPKRARSISKTRRNRRWNKRIFSKEIQEGLDYTLDKSSRSEDWDQRGIKDLTPGNIIRSLRPDFLEVMRGIVKYDGTKLTDGEISKIVRDRVVEGELDDLDREYFNRLNKKTSTRKAQKLKTNIDNKAVNETAAVALYENNRIPLSFRTEDGQLSRVAPLWKTIYEDIDTHVALDTGSSLDDKLYPTDNGTITLSTSSGDVELEVKEGDYLEVEGPDGDMQAIKLASERDHAYIVPENIRRQAVQLLGGNPNWKILDYIEYNDGDNLEFTYSTSSDSGIRTKDYYMFRILPDTIKSTISKESPLLKRTRAEYTKVSTEEAQEEALRYTANHLILNMEYDDLLLDYINTTVPFRGFFFEQEDLVFDSNIHDKRASIYVRQLPWVIIVVPTDKFENNPFKGRSKITSMDPDGYIWRELEFQPSLDPELSDTKISPYVSTKFEYYAGRSGVYGDGDTQARYYELNTSGLLSNSYKNGRRTSRRKTTFRKIKEIITELTTNYTLDNRWDTPILTEFDVFSRLTYKEFAEYYYREDYDLLKKLLEDGLFGARLVPPTRISNKQDTEISRLRYRDPDAPDDEFPVIKTSLSGREAGTPPDRPVLDDIYDTITSPPFEL